MARRQACIEEIGLRSFVASRGRPIVFSVRTPARTNVKRFAVTGDLWQAGFTPDFLESGICHVPNGPNGVSP